jgi:hypothetical protein
MLARLIVAAWLLSLPGDPERSGVMKYCTGILSLLRSMRHHDIAEEVRTAIKKGRERYCEDLARDLVKASCR